MTPAEWLESTRPVALAATMPFRRAPGATDWVAAERLWPAPADALLLASREHVTRLSPRPDAVGTMGRDHDPAREGLWWPAPVGSREKPATMPAWWAERDFVAWLAESAVAIADVRARGTGGPPRRTDVHLAVDAGSQTAAAGQLYMMDIMEPLEGAGAPSEWAVGVLARGVASASELEGMFTLGGSAKLAFAERAHVAAFECPSAVLDAFAAGRPGLRALATTPAVFENGWLPDGFDAESGEYVGRLAGIAHDLRLRAAFVSRADHVSGWDVARNRPKPADRLVPRGSVYFFERRDGVSFTRDDAAALWSAAQGQRTDEGFGRFVPGVWEPRSTPSVEEGSK